MMRNLSGVALCALLAVVAVGCGAYSFSGSTLPGHIRTVAVPLMENRTDRAELSTALADSLVTRFLDDNQLKVEPQEGADSVVEGIVLEYRRTPYTFDANEQVETYRLELVLEARFVDVRKNKVVWEEKRLSEWETYNFAGIGGQPAETEEEGIGRLLAKITENIMNRTVQGW